MKRISMKQSVALLLCLCTLALPSALRAQEWQKEGVGRKGDVYTAFKITVPSPAQLPEKVSKSIAKQLFDTTGVTINEGIKAYLGQYDELLPLSEKHVEMAGHRRQTFNIQWFDYVDGRFASLMVEVKKYNEQGKREKNRRKPLVYNLQTLRTLKLQDVFTDSALTEILGTGERHQFYVTKAGVVKVRYRIEKKWEEEDYSTADKKNLFQPTFLSLVNKEGIEQDDVMSKELFTALDTVKVKKQQPSFPGGPKALRDWLARNIRRPAGTKETGRVVVSFIVEKDGSISSVEVEDSAGPMLDSEAVHVVSSMPRWTPGIQDGRPVRVKFRLPVTFH